MEVIKGKALREDLNQYDGINQRGQRKSSSGGYVDGLLIGDEVDVLSIHGQGRNRTQTAIQNCVNSIGTRSATLKFAPGTWTIESNTTIPANLSCRIPAGCVFSISSGVTLTFSGPVITDSDNFKTGSGTLSYTDDKMLQSVAGTNTITASTLSTLTVLKNGQEFLLVPAIDITGSATLNVNSTGAVNLRKNLSAGVTALVSGDMLASNVYRLTYVAAGPYYVVQNPEYPSIGGVQLTATGAELNILDGVTSTAAELNKTDDSAAAVAGTVSAMRTYLFTDGITGAVFDVAGNVTENTFETIGPTSSGMQNEWAALSNIPAGSSILIARAITNVTPDGVDRTCTVSVHARGVGSSATTADTFLQGISVGTDDYVATGNANQGHVLIPLNASRCFEVTWLATSDTARVVTLGVIGFMK